LKNNQKLTLFASDQWQQCSLHSNDTKSRLCKGWGGAECLKNVEKRQKKYNWREDFIEGPSGKQRFWLYHSSAGVERGTTGRILEKFLPEFYFFSRLIRRKLRSYKTSW